MTTRYGMFLRPDPPTCWVQAQLNTVLLQQFGIVSAATFSPHATLVGDLRTASGVGAFVAVLNPVLRDVRPFTVHNTDVVNLGRACVYDVHTDASGVAREALVGVADVGTAVRQRDHLAQVIIAGEPEFVSMHRVRGRPFASSAVPALDGYGA